MKVRRDLIFIKSPINHAPRSQLMNADLWTAGHSLIRVRPRNNAIRMEGLGAIAPSGRRKLVASSKQKVRLWLAFIRRALRLGHFLRLGWKRRAEQCRSVMSARHHPNFFISRHTALKAVDHNNAQVWVYPTLEAVNQVRVWWGQRCEQTQNRRDSREHAAHTSPVCQNRPPAIMTGQTEEAIKQF